MRQKSDTGLLKLDHWMPYGFLKLLCKPELHSKF